MQNVIALAEKLILRYEPQLIDLATTQGKALALRIWQRYVAAAKAGTLPAQLAWAGPLIVLIDEEIAALPAA